MHKEVDKKNQIRIFRNFKIFSTEKQNQIININKNALVDKTAKKIPHLSFNFSLPQISFYKYKNKQNYLSYENKVNLRIKGNKSPMKRNDFLKKLNKSPCSNFTPEKTISSKKFDTARCKKKEISDKNNFLSTMKGEYFSNKEKEFYSNFVKITTPKGRVSHKVQNRKEINTMRNTTRNKQFNNNKITNNPPRETIQNRKWNLLNRNKISASMLSNFYLNKQINLRGTQNFSKLVELNQRLQNLKKNQNKQKEDLPIWISTPSESSESSSKNKSSNRI